MVDNFLVKKKKIRKTVHIDVSKRKPAKKKRTYEVAFKPNDDPLFNQPMLKAKRIMLSNSQESYIKDNEDMKS